MQGPYKFFWVYRLTCYKYWLGGLCSLALTSPRKTSESELEVSANSTSLTTFTRVLIATTFSKVTLFRAFVTSSILGGTSLPVVLLMMSASFAASSLFVGHIVLRTIAAYSTGLFQLVGCSFLSRSPRFRSCEAFHAYILDPGAIELLLVVF